MTLSKAPFAIPARTKVITFDIFDTLLHRLTRAPVDVFEMVRLRAFEDQRSLFHHELFDGFTETRVRAEASARQRRFDKFGSEGEITFDEIYRQWIEDTGAPQEIADWVKELELDSEKRVFFPSAEGLELYRMARASGCKIAFLSDMYLPSDWLKARLVDLEYVDAERFPVYVSGELRLSKHMGTIFEHVAKTQNWPLDATWLHVGDNAHSDVKQAKAAGLSAHHASWAHVVNTLTCRRPELQSNFVYSLVEALDLPQSQSRLPNAPLERIAYKIWGPMLFGFVCWLITNFKEQRPDRVLFVARDGWLLMRLFDICRDIVGMVDLETEYFHMSRQTGYKTGVRDWNPDRAWFYIGGKTSESAERAFSAAGLCALDYTDLLKQYGIGDPSQPLDRPQQEAVMHALNSVYADVLLKARDMRA
ncbi:MAG: HAD-IA family hydrolase, partial [Boseongicola sp.]